MCYLSFNFLTSVWTLRPRLKVLMCKRPEGTHQFQTTVFKFKNGTGYYVFKIRCIRHMRTANAQISLRVCTFCPGHGFYSSMLLHITKTCLSNSDPFKPHFYIVKLGFTGVYNIFHISAQNIDCGCSLEPPRRGGSNEYPQSMFWAKVWIISEFYLKCFSFFEVKFSINLNRRVFVMSIHWYCLGSSMARSPTQARWIVWTSAVPIWHKVAFPKLLIIKFVIKSQKI